LESSPGGNPTGITYSEATLGGKRLDLLLDAPRRSLTRFSRDESCTDLPVEEPTQFSLGVNLATAKALGVMVPPMLLARADPRGRIEMYAAHWRMIEWVAFFLLLK